MTIESFINKYLQSQPTAAVETLTWQDQKVWIKRRPGSKKTIWHRLLHYLTYIIPLPVFYPTVVERDNSLLQEAERLKNFATRNIPVPLVLAVTKEYLVSTDVGLTLQKQLETGADSGDLLKEALCALGKLHQAQLCHGRPSLRDMTLHQGKVFFIDLEEDPLAVMSLVEAQARDLWLLLISISRQYGNNPLVLKGLFEHYQTFTSTEMIEALKKMVFFLRPFRMFIEYALFFIKSKDLHSAVAANKMLEQVLKAGPIACRI